MQPTNPINLQKKAWEIAHTPDIVKAAGQQQIEHLMKSCWSKKG